MLVLKRDSGEIEHTIFRNLGRYLRAGDLLVINETRVIPARIFGRKIPTGGRVELLLLKREDETTWEALVGGKGMSAGRRVALEARPAEDPARHESPQAEVIAVLDGSRRRVRFDRPIEGYLASAGHVPLPPYIHTRLEDPERYQTVYSHTPGSAAAPTAGLHFTPGLIERLTGQGVNFATITLHVGLDTFAPVTEEHPAEHKIHTEWCRVGPEAASLVNQTHRDGGRVIAVGTTSVRSLESAAQAAAPGDRIGPFEGPTSLFILPGYPFKVIDGMVTNFHLPQSTLIMLVSAFAGREKVLETYEVAKQEGYRFFSFGDAMLII